MSQPAMDTSAFDEVKALMGDSFKDVLSLTLETLPPQMSLLESAIHNKNAEQIFSIAHRIKSASGTIGALGLANKVEQIELIGRSGSADIPASYLEALTTSFEEVITILEKETG